MQHPSRSIITFALAILAATLLMACTKTTVIERTVKQPDAGTSTETSPKPAPEATPDITPSPTPKASPTTNQEEEFFPTPEPTIVVMPEPAQRSHIFKTEALGTLVTAPEGTNVGTWQRPEWVKTAVAESGFVRPSGKIYTVLVYRKTPEETAEDWMARSELGDAYVSPKTVRTSNGVTGYTYTSNDLGAVPVVHITVVSREFVYYFHSDESEKEVPEDFLQFVREIEVQ